MMPIRRRLLAARQDCVMSGNKPIRARLSPQDWKELQTWVEQQKRPKDSGLPANNATLKDLFGMEVVEDAKVKGDLIQFDLAKKTGA